MKTLDETILIAPDTSVAEWKEEVLSFLQEYADNFPTIAMSDYQLVLQAEKEMLNEVIRFLRRT